MKLTKALTPSLFTGTSSAIANIALELDLYIPENSYAEINFCELQTIVSNSGTQFVFNRPLWAALTYDDGTFFGQTEPLPDRWAAFGMMTDVGGQTAGLAANGAGVVMLKQSTYMEAEPIPFIMGAAKLMIYAGGALSTNGTVVSSAFDIKGFVRIDYEIKKMNSTVSNALLAR